MHTSKRLFASALIAMAALAAAGTAAAQTIELKVSHYLPPNHSIHGELNRWADEIASKSNGRLKISIFPSGQMGPITRQFDLVRTGVADAAYFLHGATPGRFPLTELTALPYIFSQDGVGGVPKPLSTAEASVIATSLAGQLAKEHEGTKVLYLIAQPNASLFFSKASVRKPADMKGLRVRHNGPLPAKMIDAWGATPAAVAPVELADALEKGTVNGMTFNYEAAQAFQLAPAIKTVTELNANAVTFALVINTAKYESLPADLRKLIDDTTGIGAARRFGAYCDAAEAAGRKYVLDNKVSITVPTTEEQLAFKAAVMPLVKEMIGTTQAKGLPAQQFYDQVRARVVAVKP